MLGLVATASWGGLAELPPDSPLVDPVVFRFALGAGPLELLARLQANMVATNSTPEECQCPVIMLSLANSIEVCKAHDPAPFTQVECPKMAVAGKLCPSLSARHLAG